MKEFFGENNVSFTEAENGQFIVNVTPEGIKHLDRYNGDKTFKTTLLRSVVSKDVYTLEDVVKMAEGERRVGPKDVGVVVLGGRRYILPNATEWNASLNQSYQLDLIVGAYVWMWQQAAIGVALEATAIYVAPHLQRLFPAAKTPHQMLDELPKGKQSHVRTVKTEADLKTLHDQLTNGGTSMPSGSYPGPVTKLPDGTIVRMRPASKSGGSTIDITHPNGTLTKVHIK